MSAHDPFAPSAPATEEAAVFAEPKPSEIETPSVEASAAPVTEEATVPEGSVKDVLAWVGDDATKAQTALTAEKAGEGRKTLVAKLSEIIEK